MKKILLIVFVLLSFFAKAKETEVFDFASKGEVEANQILKDYIENYTFKFCPKATGFFYDIDNDNKKEIIGYANSGFFYSLRGYKFIVLREVFDDIDNKNVITINDRKWFMEESNVFFEPDFPIIIKGNKIIYREGDFYKNKKRSAKFKTNIIDAGIDTEVYKTYKAKNLQDVLEFSQGNTQNKFNMEDFNVQNQKKYNIKYDNVDPKVKKYLEMR